MLRLTTIGRHTAKPRSVMFGYIEDGPNLITPAMNGWADPEHASWLNLQANPHATVTLRNGETRAVTARAADPDERRRLWRRLVDLGTAAYTGVRRNALPSDGDRHPPTHNRPRDG
jgi:F420H(2)-dependent quinone reductase